MRRLAAIAALAQLTGCASLLVSRPDRDVDDSFVAMAPLGALGDVALAAGTSKAIAAGTEADDAWPAFWPIAIGLVAIDLVVALAIERHRAR